MPIDPAELWRFLPGGFLATVAIELPILMLGLSARHPWRRRVAAAVWLTACTYPCVVLVFPLVVPPAWGPGAALVAAEVFAFTAEVLLFRGVWGGGDRRADFRDAAAIVAANAASCLTGIWLQS